MGKYQAYPKYKDLGGEWFGGIPDHWVIYSSKRLFPESKKRAALEDLQLSATQDYGVISQERFMRLAGRRVVQLNSNQELRKRVDIGDFVISMRSFQGGLERAWEAGGIRSSYVVLKPVDGIVRGYFQYLFKSTRYVQALQSTANFIRDGQDMNYQNFILIDLPCPSVQEQHTISAFLDHETAKIDTLIDKQQQLIQLLKEKRQAVISHAVTKGLNPNAPMRDSGVEWLGEVPEHWDVAPIKHIVSIPVTDGPHETPVFYDEGVPFISAEAISSGKINFDKKRAHISEEDNKKYSLKYSPKKYDIYMVKSGATTGITAIVETDDKFNIWSPLAVIRCKKDSYPYFVLNFMRSYNFLEAIELNWSFGTQQNIGMGVIENLHVTRPPIDEAKLISEKLSKQCDAFDLMIDKALSAIQLMQERRTALISAAVTGKIDVRHHVSRPAGNDTIG